jgi:hypothetical protein
MSWQGVALYSSAAIPDTNTPMFLQGEIIEVLKQHDNGWLEVKTPRGEMGYLSPAWVRQLVSLPGITFLFVS